MRKNAKILCVLLIVALIAIMIISNNTNAESVEMKISDDKVTVGDTVTITLSFNTEELLTSLDIILSYNNTIFEYCDTKVYNDGKEISDGVNAGGGEVIYSAPQTETETTTLSGNIKIEFEFEATSEGENAEFEVNTLALNTSDGESVTVEKPETKTVTVEKKQINPILDGISTDETLNIEIDEEKQITVNNANNFNTIEWSSSDESIVSVSEGKITGKAEGNASITVNGKDSTGAVIGTTSFNVNVTNGGNTDEPVTEELKLYNGDKNEVTDGSITLTEGSTVTITANRAVTSWISSDTSIATVDENGKITGVTASDKSVTITATDTNGLSSSVTVKVTNAGNSGGGNTPDTSAPVLSKNSITLTVGSSETITADRAVTWYSSDPSIATVDENGKITGVTASDRSIIIIATDANGLASSVTVTVTNEGNTGGGDGEQTGGDTGSQGENETGGGTGTGNGEENNIGNNAGTENGTQGGTSGNTGSSSAGVSNTGSSNSGTGGASTKNSASSANENVPATGETTTSTIAILVIVTLIVASVIFRKNSRMK